jgi:hypothetical protein
MTDHFQLFCSSGFVFGQRVKKIYIKLAAPTSELLGNIDRRCPKLLVIVARNRTKDDRHRTLKLTLLLRGDSIRAHTQRMHHDMMINMVRKQTIIFSQANI